MTIVLVVAKNGYSVKDSISFYGSVSKIKINNCSARFFHEQTF